jgi:N-acetylneuraminate synthase
MSTTVNIGEQMIGLDQPTYVVAEIGINHNGDIDIAKRLIDVAVLAGCDAVKFQKRTPELCVPPEQREILRETPWGLITYLDYRYKVEFDESQYAEIDRYCAEKGISWFASPWDEPSVEFLEQFNPVAHKVASASITDHSLLKSLRETDRTVILSTGMSTMDEIRGAVAQLDRDRLIITHATSSYPCPPNELNLRMIHTLEAEFNVPVGYSGHETGLSTTVGAVALGACLVERHVTLDRAMWGTDQAASVEPAGLMRLVRDIRVLGQAMGDGIKQVYDSELQPRAKLRRV